MPELTVGDILAVTGGRVSQEFPNLRFSHFHFDTRLMHSDHSLFFALKTDQNNGHNYLKTIKNTRDSAAVVSRSFKESVGPLPLIRVNDPLKAVHQLAAHVRKKWKGVTYVGITGSAGKTTTKEFLYQILAQKYSVFRSIENWNNWIGLPFSMLEMAGTEQIAVFELAMSYPGIGEIDFLAEILKPDVAVILNVFPVHLEFLKSMNNIARGKSEILNYLESDGTAFITGDSDLIRMQTREKKGRKIYFGRSSEGNHIRLSGVRRVGDGSRITVDFYGIKTDFTTNIINRTHIENLFSAIIVAQHLGMKNFEIQGALSQIQPLSGRGKINRYKHFTVIDETYNSNPEALAKTLKWVNEEFKNKKIAVVGDMLELGEREADFHLEAGKFFATLGFDMLITVGERSEKIAEGARAGGFDPDRIKICDNAEQAGRFLKGCVPPEAVIVLKASRGMKLEGAIEELCDE